MLCYAILYYTILYYNYCTIVYYNTISYNDNYSTPSSTTVCPARQTDSFVVIVIVSVTPSLRNEYDKNNINEYDDINEYVL